MARREHAWRRDNGSALLVGSLRLLSLCQLSLSTQKGISDASGSSGFHLKLHVAGLKEHVERQIPYFGGAASAASIAAQRLRRLRRASSE
jgi:hypothetical protein